MLFPGLLKYVLNEFQHTVVETESIICHVCRCYYPEVKFNTRQGRTLLDRFDITANQIS